jgi:hypothetical protein
MEMVKCMNAVFSQLDTITDRHLVYKVSFSDKLRQIIEIISSSHIFF